MMTSPKNADTPEARRISLSPQPMFHRVLRAQPLTVRDTLADIRRRFAAEIDEDALGRLELVLAEVMNNVAEHGPGHPASGDQASGRRSGDRAEDRANDRIEDGAPLIHLCIVRHTGGLSCAITDDGVSLPLGCLLPRGTPSTGELDLPEGGFGWFLIQDLTQELCYYREERRNFLAFRVPVTDEADSPLPDGYRAQFSGDCSG
jgi:serine/threonine-protein kinase RsbW